MSIIYASQLVCTQLLLPQHNIQLGLMSAYKLECPLVGCMSILNPFLRNKAAASPTVLVEKGPHPASL